MTTLNTRQHIIINLLPTLISSHFQTSPREKLVPSHLVEIAGMFADCIICDSSPPPPPTASAENCKGGTLDT